MHLTIACLARNEGSRFLPDALRVWSGFADSVVLLDDNSTDNTRQLATDAGAVVQCRDAVPAWGAEAPARQELWDLAMSNTPADGHVLFLDADMIPARNPRELLQGRSDAWAFVLFDLWDDRHGKLYYREDGFWQGHLHPRIWMIRKPAPQDWVWNDRGIHSGHLPANYAPQSLGVAPFDMGLLHTAYLTPALRAAKRAQYGDVSAISTTHEQRHAASITDPNPRLLPLPFVPEYTIGLASDRMAA